MAYCEVAAFRSPTVRRVWFQLTNFTYVYTPCVHMFSNSIKRISNGAVYLLQQSIRFQFLIKTQTTCTISSGSVYKTKLFQVFLGFFSRLHFIRSSFTQVLFHAFTSADVAFFQPGAVTRRKSPADFHLPNSAHSSIYKIYTKITNGNKKKVVLHNSKATDGCIKID